MTMWGTSLLERYIAVATLEALGVVSAGLTTLFSLLEFVDQLHDVGKGRYRLIDALFYVLLTAPERLLQLMPAAMLFACLFALGSLASRSELTAMRAGGVSPHRIVGSVFKLAGCTVVALFLLAQFVIPPAQQLAQAERASRLSTAEAVRSGNSFWAAGDRQFLNVRRFDNGNTPSDIYLYEFAANGALERLIQADHAEVRPDGTWLLEEVSRKRFSDDRSAAEEIPRSADGDRSAAEGIPRSASGATWDATRGTRIETDRLASLVWQPFLRPRQASVLILPANSMQPIELYQYVRDLEQRNQPAARYAQELWAKIDLPLAMAAMILIAAPFVFGPLRTRGTGQRMMIGTMIGIVFSLVQQITVYLGQLLNLSPALTATVPSVVLMALAVYLFRRAVA
jgi:lipopolysaccharide export system permease protein